MRVRTAFTSWNVEKVHAVVARSIFPSPESKTMQGLDHFWKLRYRQSARRCGAKHIFQVKSVTNWRVRANSWTFRSRFAWQAQGNLHFAESGQSVNVFKQVFAWQAQGNLHLAESGQSVNVLKQLQLQLERQLQLRLNDATLYSTTQPSTTHRYSPSHYTTLY